jgi:hypothetical protein
MILLMIVSAAQAQTEPVLTQTTNYALTESIGLLGTTDKDSFGNGVYLGTKRSELTALLKLIEQSQWVAMRPLVKNFLLTEAESSALTQDIPVTLGEDLLTLRINALLRIGYNREAFELYRKASSNKLDEPTTRAGVYTMLLNRQKGLACLEVKTVAPQYKNIPLWNVLNTYCEISLPNETAPKQYNEEIFSQYPVLRSLTTLANFSYTYDPTNFSALSMLERAAISSEGIMTTSYVSADTISEIPPNHIAILLAQPNINDLQKALLLGAAIDYAIEQPKALSAYYEELLILHSNGEKKKEESEPPTNKLATSPATEDLLALASLYNETKGSWLGNERAEKISQAIALSRKYSDKLLIPFLPVISKLDLVKELSLEDALSIAPLYLYTHKDISNEWIKDLLKADFIDNNQKTMTRENLLISLFLLYENSNDALRDKAYEYMSSAASHTNLKKDIKNIIENIDSAPTNDDKVPIKDVNGFDLDIDKGYTMPPYRVLNTLKQASDDQDISVSFLLSACILSKIDRQSAYIGTLGDIASALKKVGIKNAPRHIIAQAFMQAGKDIKTETEL